MKSHAIQTRIARSGKRLKILHSVQRRNGRSEVLSPKPGVVTCWNSELIEVTRANITMGDTNEALKLMLAEKGMDKDLLKDSKGKKVALDDLIYTAKD